MKVSNRKCLVVLAWVTLAITVIFAPVTSTGVTGVMIDGDDADWDSYPISYESTQTHLGTVISRIKLFRNDGALYLLLEIEGPWLAGYRVLLDINKPGEYQVSIEYSDSPMAELSRIEGERFAPVGSAGDVAFGEVLEVRIPLSALEGTIPQRLNVRLIDGDDEANTLSDSGLIVVPVVDEAEPYYLKMGTSSADAPSFLEVALPSLTPAPVDPRVHIAEGWHAEEFIPPNGLTAPARMAFTTGGDLLITEVRGWSISRLTADGELSTFVELPGIPIFFFAIDGEDNVYVYRSEDRAGTLYRIHPDGEKDLLVWRSPSLASGMGVAVAMAADAVGNVYIAFSESGPGVDSSLLRWVQVTPGGAINIKNPDFSIQNVHALEFDKEGNLYAATCREVYRVDPETGDILEEIFDAKDFPELGFRCTSAYGMAIGEDGSIYLTDWSSAYRIDRNGQVSVLGRDFNRIEGIAVDREGSVYVASRVDGGVYRILEGRIEVAVPPNFIATPQAMAFSPTGDLFVCNDEGVVVGQYGPDGEFIAFYEALVTQPPLAAITVDTDGDVYVAEAEPGWPSQVVVIHPGNPQKQVVTDAVVKPAGVVVRDGILYVSEHDANRISTISEDGNVTPYFTGVNLPGPLAVDPAGNLLVLAKLPADASATRSVVRISPDLKAEVVFTHADLASLAVLLDGTILAGTAGWRIGDGTVYVIDPSGRASVLLSGTTSAAGIAVDREGRIYVSDEVENRILRLMRE